MAEEILMIALSPTMEEGQIVQWNKSEGDAVSSGDVLCEVETDKATMDYESSHDGVLLKIVMDSGHTAKIGDLIAVVGEENEDFSKILSKNKHKENKQEAPATQKTETATQDAKAGKPSAAVSSKAVIASPLARVIATEKGIDLRTIKGSGPGGRIIKRDLENIQEKVSVQSIPISTAEGDIELPISQKRKTIAKRLSESKYSAPHYYLKLTIDMDYMMSARQSLNASLKDMKVGFNSFLMKFVAETLKKHPIVNSSWQNTRIIQFQNADIGLAVAQDEGLITPVVRNCGNKGIVEIEKELKELIPKAQAGSLSTEEYSNCSFTISSLGSFGIDEFTAIINPPGAAILAVGAIKKEAVVNDENEIVIKNRMKLSLSCDHRIIDGAVGAAFLSDLKLNIENPVRILY